MYPGTKGSTQGDKNEINPASDATGSATIKYPEKICSTTKFLIRLLTALSNYSDQLLWLVQKCEQPLVLAYL